MSTLLIVYHSMTGGTLQMAQAAAAGARSEPACECRCCAPTRRRRADVLRRRRVHIRDPENLAAMSGKMKDFFDRTYYAALDRLNGRPYATLICAGSDGRNAAQQIERIATGWRLRPIADPIIVCTHAQTPEEILRPKHIAEQDLRSCEALGATMAAGIAMGIF